MANRSETLAISPPLAPRLRPQAWIIAIALLLFTLGAIAISHYGWKQSVLFLMGGLLGLTLYHASFGFASAYRRLVVRREVQGIYAQLVMLAIATVLFAPLLASGSAWGQPVRGAVAPVGVSGAIGAFLFGIGMQLGGACGCGTLYTLGSGSLTMLLTLITFCGGAFGASLTRQLWSSLPASPQPIVLGSAIGWPAAVAGQLVLLGLLGLGLRWWSQTQGRSGFPQLSLPTRASVFPALWRGPWSPLAGAVALALLNTLTLMLSGQPWRITWGFALWSAQIATWLGWQSSSSPFWSTALAQKALNQSIFADVSSVMNLGIILGAVLAAALAGRWVAQGQVTQFKAIATLGGGLIMGYGAFLAAGCNVSAFFGGIASTSVHGWVWIFCALAGTHIGVRLRPLFRLDR